MDPPPFFVDHAQIFSIGDDSAPQRKIGALNVLEQILRFGIGIFDQMDAGSDDFAEVVRRNIRRHAHRDSGSTVEQQVGEPGRQNNRFHLAAIIVRAHFNRLELQLFNQMLGNLRDLGFGITRRRGRQPHDRTEVSLTMDQRVPQGEILRHPNQGVVNGHFAVRMIIAHRRTADFGAFERLAIGGEMQVLVHRVDDSPLNRLQAVTNVGQRPRRDNRHGVIQITTPRLLTERDVFNSVGNFRSFFTVPTRGCTFRQFQLRSYFTAASEFVPAGVRVVASRIFCCRRFFLLFVGRARGLS